MCVDDQPIGVAEGLLNISERALPTFSESLKGVAMKNFPGGRAPRPPQCPFVSGPTPMLDPPLTPGNGLLRMKIQEQAN